MLMASGIDFLCLCSIRSREGPDLCATCWWRSSPVLRVRWCSSFRTLAKRQGGMLGAIDHPPASGDFPQKHSLCFPLETKLFLLRSKALSLKTEVVYTEPLCMYFLCGSAAMQQVLLLYLVHAPVTAELVSVSSVKSIMHTWIQYYVSHRGCC